MVFDVFILLLSVHLCCKGKVRNITGENTTPYLNRSSLEQQDQPLKSLIFLNSCSPNAGFCMFHFTNRLIVSLEKLHLLSMDI